MPRERRRSYVPTQSMGTSLSRFNMPTLRDDMPPAIYSPVLQTGGSIGKAPAHYPSGRNAQPTQLRLHVAENAKCDITTCCLTSNCSAQNRTASVTINAMPSLSIRRPRFTLRAILVAMTLLVFFLGYQLVWARQRRALIRSGEVAPGYVSMQASWPPKAPALLRFFGEPGYYELSVRITDRAASRAEIARVKRIFPEAEYVYARYEDD